MEEGRRRAFDGDPGWLWIVADEQIAGRGRRGRAWASPSGNLYASALLIAPCAPANAAQLGFVAGVALARAVRDVGASARLKWPNDLVLGGAKCAGLLVEGLQLADRRFACIVGIGVNCASAPDAVGYPTAVLSDHAGAPIKAGALFSRLQTRFAEALRDWRGGEDFAAICSAWLAQTGPIGERIRISGPYRRRDGVFEGLDVDGRLLFRGEQGIEAVETADLWILPEMDDLPAMDASALAGEGRI